MATIYEVERVVYKCTCKRRLPLCKLYFCRHCIKLRCGWCVQNEVESYFCPNCLEHMPPAEARLKKLRCANCFDCPSCGSTLATRVTAVTTSQEAGTGTGEEGTTQKKFYYLACSFCRWTTRDAGLPDAEAATGGWPAQTHINAKRISALMDYYQQVAHRESAEKIKKKSPRRRQLPATIDKKYGLLSVALKKRSPLSALSMRDLDDSLGSVADVEPAIASESVVPLPKDLLTVPVHLETVTTLEQRHSSPDTQPESTGKLYPLRKPLVIKKSQRCKECDHNLCKPDFGPSSVKFKIQLLAIFHLPDIKIVPGFSLLYQKESRVVLTLTNPVEAPVDVCVLCESDNPLATAKVDISASVLKLAARDVASMLDEEGHSSGEYADDRDVVAFRKSNKIGVFAKVTPLKATGDVKVALMLQYWYSTAVPQQMDKTRIEVAVLVNLGSVAAN